MAEHNNTKVVSLRIYFEVISKAYQEKNPELTEKEAKRQASQSWEEFVEKTFFCAKNQDVVTFLRNRAVNNEYHHATRTFLLLSEDQSVLGFFTLAFKSMDISDFDNKMKKIYIYSGKSPKTVMEIPTVLIAQFGKKDLFTKQITGSEMMEVALEKINELRDIIGTKIVMLDSVNNEKVIRFYQNFGFQIFGNIVIDSDSNLQPMFLDVSK